MRKGSQVSVPFGTQINKMHPQANGLILCLPLNELGGPTAYERSGFSKNASFVALGGGSPVFKASPIRGMAMLTNSVSAGNSGYLSISAVGNNMAALTNFSISFWVYIVTFSGSAGFNQYLMVNNGTNANYFGILYRADLNQVWLQSNGFITTSQTMATGLTYHIVYTRVADGGTNNCKLYINGINTKNATLANNPSVGVSGSLAIGTDQINSSRGTSAYYSDFRIYNRVLPPTEVSQMYINPNALYRENNRYDSKKINHVTNKGYLIN